MRYSLTSFASVLSFIAAFGLPGCATGGGDGEACTRSSECEGMCENGRCVPEVDAARPDAGIDGSVPDAGSDGAALSDVAVTLDAARDAVGSDVPLPRDTGVRVDVPSGPCAAAGCVGSVLRDGAGAWTPIAVDPASPFAPPSPVVGAFDIESLNVAYVLTDTTFHVLRLSDGAYIASGSLSARFPGVVGSVLSATSVPAGHAGGDANLESVTLATRDIVYIFEYNITTERFRQSAEPVDYSDDWDSAFAPDRNAVLGAWLALENEDGWLPGSPRSTCAANADAFAVYAAYLADGQVHLFDAGHCGDFVARIPATSFVPFQLPAAPDFSRIGGSFYHQGDLWVLNARSR
ncbi:MAG: hypothetical protein AB8H86_21205 [Polyangiales bacterium]